MTIDLVVKTIRMKGVQWQEEALESIGKLLTSMENEISINSATIAEHENRYENIIEELKEDLDEIKDECFILNERMEKCEAFMELVNNCLSMFDKVKL